MMKMLDHVDPTMLDGFPKLVALVNSVRSIPKVAEFVAKHQK